MCIVIGPDYVQGKWFSYTDIPCTVGSTDVLLCSFVSRATTDFGLVLPTN